MPSVFADDKEEDRILLRLQRTETNSLGRNDVNQSHTDATDDVAENNVDI